MVSQKKNYTAIAISLLATLVAIVLGLWPLLVLITPCLLIFLLLRTPEKKSVPIAPVSSQAPPALPTEQSVLTVAFGVLQRRITEAVHCTYPTARWTWSTQNARERFATGSPLAIMLNGTGGYREAMVLVRELQFCGLVYKTVNAPTPPAPGSDRVEPAQEPTPSEDQSADYGLLAFEWVDVNLQQLNAQGNEAIAQGKDGFRILAGDLPHGDSWPAVCKELLRCGFAAAEVLADGIQVQIKTEKGV